ncbi:MAG: hypothetical protein KY457_06620 [Actinobacteria bacterium]|nr:hypothetical protein [Actinomycetota bacterium]
MRAMIVAVVLAVTGVLVAVPPASACSCAPATIEDVVAREPGAVAGLVRRVDDGSVREAGTLAVLAELHGELPDVVSVRLDDGASCRPMVAPRQIAALTFRPEGGGWAAVDCGMLDLGTSLARVGGDVAPDPEATGPPALVVAGSFPGASLVAVDAELRVLGVADVEGWIDRVVRCGDEVVDIRMEDVTAVVERRSLPDLTVVATLRLDRPEGWQLLAVRCDDAGRLQTVAATPAGDATVVTPDLLGAPAITFSGPSAGGATFVDDQVWLMAGDNDARTSRIVTVDLGTGAVATRRSFRGLAGSDLSASPDGRFVTVRGFAEEPVLLVLDAASATPVGEAAGSWMPVGHGWLGPDRLLLQDESRQDGADMRLRVVDERLRVVEETTVPAGSPMALAGDAVVLGGGSELTVRRPDGSLHASPDLRLIGASQAVALGEVRGPDEELAAPAPVDELPDGDAGTRPAWQLTAATLATVAVLGALVVLRRRRRTRD